jgi:hypothetical protein
MKPVAHFVKSHLFAEHAGDPLSVLQAKPHAPQLRTSDLVSRQRPSQHSALPVQGLLAEQLSAHVPLLLQVFVASLQGNVVGTHSTHW